MEEVINLDINDNDLLIDLDKPSVNFGDGAELLMNDKKKVDKSQSVSLEEELNELNNLGSTENNSFLGKETVNFGVPNDNTFSFKKIDEINIEEQENKFETKNKEDILKEKFNFLKKLEHLESKGVTLTKRYSMESSLEEMKGEYENIISEKEKTNSIKFQGKVLTTMITGIEFLNNKLDPFDLKIDGWSEQINENIEDYDDIFSELHEKYKSKAKMAPEIKILFQLAASGMMIHMTNTMFKSAIPGMDDIMRQNPDLMNNFTKAAVNSMEQNNPGVRNFMNDFGMSHNESPPRAGPQEYREEMKAPENINNILNNLNKKDDIGDKNPSVVSLDDIDDISIQSTPSAKSSRRKSKNENKISLAL